MERRLIAAGSGGVAVCYHAPVVEIDGLPLLVALHDGVGCDGHGGTVTPQAAR